MDLKDRILKIAGGQKVVAVATVDEESGQVLPAVRYMVTFGLDDLTLIGSTSRGSRKVQQMKKNSNVALTIWEGGDFSNPYVIMTAKAEVHENLETKKKYWNTELEKYFKNPDNPEYVVIKFMPSKIEYYHDMKMNIWTK
jgi:general stress protein 26